MNRTSDAATKVRIAATLALVVLACLPTNIAFAAESVTDDNFVRAETDTTMRRYVSQGAFGKFLRDTLYSAAVFSATPMAVSRCTSAVIRRAPTSCPSCRA